MGEALATQDTRSDAALDYEVVIVGEHDPFG